MSESSLSITMLLERVLAQNNCPIGDIYFNVNHGAFKGRLRVMIINEFH